MITIDDYQAIIRKVEKLKRLHDQAKGERKQLIKRLKERFGKETLEEAMEVLEDLKDKEIVAARKWSKLLIRFKEKWKSQLEGI